MRWISRRVLLTLFVFLALWGSADVQAQPTGAVEGRVFDADSGDPLAGVAVIVSTAEEPGGGLPGQEGSAVTGADGRYRVEGLQAGSYRAFVIDPRNGYIGQIYMQIPCFFFNAAFGGCRDFLPFVGDRFDVTAGATVRDIDFPLELGGEIRGRILDGETGAPVRTFVGLTFAGGDETTLVAQTGSDPQGVFRFRSLPGGTYSLIVQGVEGVFGGSFPGNTVELGEVVEVTLELQPWTTISGSLVEEGSGDPAPGGFVWIFDAAGAPLMGAEVDLEGNYRSAHLEDGTYYLRSGVGFDRPWIDQRFGGGTCVSYRPCDVTGGTPVVIAGGTSVTGVDFVLPVGGRIAGTTLRGSEPVLTPVVVYTEDGTFVGTDFSDRETGTYEVQGLVAGTYFLLGLGDSEPPQLYENLPCGPDNSRPTCDVTTGTPVPVAEGETTPEIDFTFPISSPGECVSTAARLCLNGGRFEVEMFWEKPDFTAGNAAAVDLPFADDSGYFWFFDEDNVEVVVKILDACHTRFNSFWVFAAGLTNLRVVMTVTDTVSGEVRTYENSQQTAYQPILDTRAFRTCDATVPGGGSLGSAADSLWPALDLGAVVPPAAGTAPSHLPLFTAADAVFGPASAQAQARGLLATLPGQGQAGCVPGNTALCLQGGRFRVEAEWTRPDGSSGAGVADPLTADTGVFSFFGRDNLELVVKVLSNCSGRTHRFWVFAGGLTNLEVVLTVTDTISGAVRTYVNPQGQAYRPVQDTRAFDTCDAG